MGRLMRRALAGLTFALLLPSCQLPLGLGLPTTRELMNGAAANLSATSLEVAGSYVESGRRWDVELQITRPGAQHVVASMEGLRIEAIVIGKDAYFRGQELLAQHLNADVASISLAKAAGNAWWKGLSPTPRPDFADFTDAARVKAAFLNADLVTRRDHVLVDGVESAELSGSRADVYIREAAPHELLHLHMLSGTTVGGMVLADLKFNNYGKDFKIVAPSEVIDFADLSTLPPNYTVLSVDASGCGTPCVVKAALKNLGGGTGGKAPSTVTFEMTDLASGKVVGSCTTNVAPDVGYNATTTVSCTVAKPAAVDFGPSRVTASPTNPGHA